MYEELKCLKQKKLYGVRIVPRQLIWENGYEGKKFQKKIIFQNTSNKPVIIRTMPPTSKVSYIL